MRWSSRTALLAVSLLFAMSAPGAACELKNLIGTYQCSGGCKGPGSASLWENAPGKFRWKDGVGNEGIASINGNNITILFPNGSVYSGLLDPTCQQITWPDGHTDRLN
jgi:hypothetical protein